MSKKLFFIGMMLFFTIACGNETIEKVEEKFQDETPKVIGVYESVDGKETKTKEKIFYKSGKLMMEGSIKDNKREGEWKAYHENGNIWSEGVFVGGERNGYGKNYYENGKLREEGNYTNGKQTGNWKYYNKQGVLVEERNK